ncbi:ATP-binding protein [Stenotrophobium rhamnosiphilum]|nr:ATP-binding protein [Stenotrophobium rhamnosiphilum]
MTTANHIHPSMRRTRPMLDPAGVKNMKQLIDLRWIAVIGQIITIVFTQWVFHIPLPVELMIGILSSLIGLNLLSLFRWYTLPSASNLELMTGFLIDVGALTALLYLSGGATNPFVFLYPLQLALAAVLLASWSTWTLVGITSICFAGLTRFYVPLQLPAGGVEQLFDLHIIGMWICFVLDAVLLIVFMSRINRNLRERDANLAGMRQRAAEEDHIVRMGLLASGAAHELGTPLATLAVTLNDWRRMPQFKNDPEMLQEIGELQHELDRCKTIVSGILMSSGEARGGSIVVTNASDFVIDLVREWSSSRNSKALKYGRFAGEDCRIVSDSALKQIISNVLDNAAEVSPEWVKLTATHADGMFTITVRDRGPGFTPEILENLGKPYQSTKGKVGGGLGLFLVMNIVRKLGGSMSAENGEEGGAIVTLQMPMDALSMEDEDVGHIWV